MRRSHASASDSPAPTHAPSIIAITGFGSARSVRHDLREHDEQFARAHVARLGQPLRHRLQIAARGEGAAGAGHHQDAHVGIGRRRRRRAAPRRATRSGPSAFLTSRAIDRERRDPLGDLVTNRLASVSAVIADPPSRLAAASAGASASTAASATRVGDAGEGQLAARATQARQPQARPPADRSPAPRRARRAARVAERERLVARRPDWSRAAARQRRRRLVALGVDARYSAARRRRRARRRRGVQEALERAHAIVGARSPWRAPRSASTAGWRSHSAAKGSVPSRGAGSRHSPSAAVLPDEREAQRRHRRAATRTPGARTPSRPATVENAAWLRRNACSGPAHARRQRARRQEIAPDRHRLGHQLLRARGARAPRRG